ncbi:MAG: hypothetical protein IKR40_09785 [Treponema sp.]|nr:hypothetical protein [Treponema sp.]
MKKVLNVVPAIAAVIILTIILVSHKSQSKNLPKPKQILENSSILVEDYCYGILPEDFDGNTILFSVYKDGKLTDSVKAKKLIKDIDGFKKENSDDNTYFIGNLLSVFDDGIVLDGLSEQMWYDFKTKKFYSSNEEETARKIDKLCLNELDDLLSATLPLVQDEKDRGIILQIQDSIHSESHENLNYRYTHAYLKIAHENLIKAWYSYKTDSIPHINLFILMEDSSLLMDIYGGGDKKTMEEQGRPTYDFDPSRCYTYYPKTDEFSSYDFYWE